MYSACAVRGSLVDHDSPHELRSPALAGRSSSSFGPPAGCGCFQTLTFRAKATHEAMRHQIWRAGLDMALDVI